MPLRHSNSIVQASRFGCLITTMSCASFMTFSLLSAFSPDGSTIKVSYALASSFSSYSRLSSSSLVQLMISSYMPSSGLAAYISFFTEEVVFSSVAPMRSRLSSMRRLIVEASCVSWISAIRV
ncbi:hypothetical protein IG631_02373 [Alternaria alternata]|nr:hypothetical protein IG631_02373 [Alternaria alternata]